MDSLDQSNAENHDEWSRIWLKRARGVLIGQYATDELVEIYGLKLQPLEGRGGFCDIFFEEQNPDSDQSDYRYIDTLNLTQFATARQILYQLASYFPDDREPPEEPSEEDDDPGPSPIYQ